MELSLPWFPVINGKISASWMHAGKHPENAASYKYADASFCMLVNKHVFSEAIFAPFSESSLTKRQNRVQSSQEIGLFSATGCLSNSNTAAWMLQTTTASVPPIFTSTVYHVLKIFPGDSGGIELHSDRISSLHLPRLPLVPLHE